MSGDRGKGANSRLRGDSDKPNAPGLVGHAQRARGRVENRLVPPRKAARLTGARGFPGLPARGALRAGRVIPLPSPPTRNLARAPLLHSP